MRIEKFPFIIIFGILIVGFVYYQSIYISLGGFSITKNNIKNVIVSTQDKTYMVTNQQVVFDLAERVSKMQRSQKIDFMRFPPGSTSEPYRKLLIQTKDHVTYGGSIWNLSAGNALDSAGYYWIVQDDLVTALDKAINDSQTTQLS
ncbi:MAG: hypothetical protein P4L49_21005 [Desulfosporosinus sp.]|nr:hypothetical protein [Desulfosporosinus sp.]